MYPVPADAPKQRPVKNALPCPALIHSFMLHLNTAIQYVLSITFAKAFRNRAETAQAAPPVWGKQGFGGKAGNTLRFLTEQVIPALKQQFALPENVQIILGGYSLAGLFALWASTQTALFSDVATASPSVWFPGWMEFEQQHPMQTQHIYLSLGDKEEHTKNAVMAAVGDNIRTLHSRLAERGTDCTLEWNSGGHFKDADLRTARAFQWVMEESR